MFAQAIYATDEGRCQRGEVHDLGAVLRAMTGGRGGPGGGRGRGRHRGFGPGAESGYGGFPVGRPRRGARGRGGKARRGDIRTAALLLLAEEPRNGYQIMQEVEERSEGVWRPSPGSVYPALAQLEDEGLIRSEEVDGRKLFALTDAGEKVVQERRDDLVAPWEEMSESVDDDVASLFREMRQVGMAAGQIGHMGSAHQI